MFLMIENKGEANIHALTVLGHSTSRGNVEKLGQFGSGYLHGINVCLRENMNPQMYIGDESLKFFSEPRDGYNVICYFYQGQKKELNISDQYGSYDWKGIGLALREFVSNAIDNAEDNKPKVEIVEEPKKRSGYTRIFIPLNNEVQNFYKNIGEWFLHFSGRNKIGHLKKKVVGKPKIYRKGVFIREVATPLNSIFDYNFGDEITIDESRQLDDSKARHYIGDYLSQNVEALTAVFSSTTENEVAFEASLPSYFFNTWNNNEVFNEAWDNVFPDAIIDDGNGCADFARRKGYKIKQLGEQLYSLLKNVGIKTTASVITKVESEGNEILEPTSKTVRTFNKVWNNLEEIGMTMGKRKPQVKSFKKIMSGDSLEMGYYQDGVVYINTCSEDCFQTMLEEIAHYITGATDNSRDFQDYAFRVATEAMKK